MQENDRAVFDLLSKHDYVTRVVKEGDGCVITFPHPRLLAPDMPRVVEHIALVRGTGQGLKVETSAAEGERFIPVPEYAARLYIVSEIAAIHQRLGLDQDLVVYVNDAGDGNDNIRSIIDAPSTEEERNRERFLYTLFVGAVADGFPDEYVGVAATNGVKDGYDVLRKFYV